MIQQFCIQPTKRGAITMNMYNDNFNEMETFDDEEFMRMEALIEERDAYEEEFFSMEPSHDEQYFRQLELYLEIAEPEVNFIPDDLEEDIDYPFEMEDYFNVLRDERLIKEREAYEAKFISSIPYEGFASNDLIEYQVESMDEEEFFDRNGYGYDFSYEPEFTDFDYGMPDYELYHERHYIEPESCNCAYMDYMPNDYGFNDCLECYDYPEGPEENLCGIKYF